MNSIYKYQTIIKAPSVLRRFIGISQFRNASFKVQDDKDFAEKVENSKDIILVDFFATWVKHFLDNSNKIEDKLHVHFSWCGPCKALEPRLQNVIAQKKGQISLAKVDIDDLGELAAKYEVSKTYIWSYILN